MDKAIHFRTMDIYTNNQRSDWFVTVPSQSPANLSVASQTSTSILASWQLPPADSRNGIILGFKLFYKRKGSADSANIELVQGGTTLRKTITGLLKYTEYEVQVLAFTAVGDGLKSVIKTVRTGTVGRLNISQNSFALHFAILILNRTYCTCLTNSCSNP